MKKNFLHIIVFLSALQTKAQTATPADTVYLTLPQILEKVEQAYPSLKHYDEKVKAIEQRIAGATAWMAPMFSLSPSNFAYRSSMWKEESPMNQAGIMFSLTQNIPNPVRLNAQKNYYASLTAVERASQQWTKNTLRREAKLFYIQRLVAERKLAILAESQELLNLIIKVAEDKYVYNQAELSVIYKARSRRGDLSNMRLMQLSTIQSANIGLNTLMNQDPFIPLKIDTSVNLLNDERVENRYPDSIFLAVRSDIKAVTTTIQSMQKDQAARAAMRKPDFMVGVTHNQMLGMPKSWSVMGGISIPIVPWVSRGWKAEVRMMDYEIAAMQREKETMQLMARQMAAERLTMLRFEKQQYNTYTMTILPELRKNVETSLLQYRQTTGNLFVLLDAWDMLLMKKVEQVDKLGTVLQLQAQYEYEIEK